jgi:hypothetical protein
MSWAADQSALATILPGELKHGLASLEGQMRN